MPHAGPPDPHCAQRALQAAGRFPKTVLPADAAARAPRDPDRYRSVRQPFPKFQNGKWLVHRARSTADARRCPQSALLSNQWSVSSAVPIILVFEPHDVVLAEIASGLHLDDFEWYVAWVFQPVRRAQGQRYSINSRAQRTLVTTKSNVGR